MGIGRLLFRFGGSLVRNVRIGFYTLFGIETYREVVKYGNGNSNLRLEEVGILGKIVSICDKTFFSMKEMLYIIINNIAFTLQLPIYIITWCTIIMLVLVVWFVIKRYIRLLVWLVPFYSRLKAKREAESARKEQEREINVNKLKELENELSELRRAKRENEFMKAHIEKLNSKLEK